jgi:hypothetical protein
VTTDILDRPTVDVRERYYAAYKRLNEYAMQDMGKGYDTWAALEFRFADAAFEEYRAECRLAGVEPKRA